MDWKTPEERDVYWENRLEMMRAAVKIDDNPRSVQCRENAKKRGKPRINYPG